MGNPVLYLMVFVYIVFATALPAAAQTLNIGKHQDQYALSTYLEILEDPGREMGIKEVSESTAFVHNRRDVPNFGFTASNIWLRFRVANGSDSDVEEWILDLEVPSMEEVDLYLPDASGGFTALQSGLRIPLSERPINSHGHAFKLLLKPGETKTIHMRLASRTSMVVYLKLHGPEHFFKKNRMVISLMFFIAGLLTAIILSNLILFYALKDRNYFWFAFFATSLGMFLASNFGILHLYLWPESPEIAMLASPVFGSLSLLSGSLFSRSMLNTKVHFPRLDLTFICFAFFAAGLVIWSFVHTQSANILVGGEAFFIFLITSYVCFIRLKTPFEAIRLFWFLMLLSLVGGLLFTLMTFGYMSFNFLSFSIGPLSFILAALLLVMAFANRYAIYQSNYLELFDKVKDAVLFSDANSGEILEANKESLKLFGYTSTEMMRIGLEGLIDPKARETVNVQSIFEPDDGSERGSKLLLLPLRKKNDDSFVGEVVFRRVEKGKRECLLAVIRDVTEHRKEEVRLRHQQKLESVGILASGVAHEINNPINIIMNYATLIGEQYDQKKDVLHYAKEIEKESDRIGKIVKGLLTFSRKEVEPSRPLAMAEVLEYTLTLIRKVLEKDGIHLWIDVPHELPNVTGKQQQIIQILLNLITNARQALNERYPKRHENKKMNIRSFTIEESDKIFLRTEVEDHGMGIPEEAQSNIFDPFFTTKLAGDGTGLGLSISYGIAMEHGGQLSFETQPGEGTCFYLDLPAVQD